MRDSSSDVQNFPLTNIQEVTSRFTRLPSGITDILYHYTNKSGLEGILRHGGLRATYRMNMNDAGEFRYAQNLIYDTLDRLIRCAKFTRSVHRLCEYTRTNLQHIFQETQTTNWCSAYCACLSVHPDDAKLWRTYASGGMGFALGFNFYRLGEDQSLKAKNQSPYILSLPVKYERSQQRRLVENFIKAGISDLQKFEQQYSPQSEALTALRNRIMQEIIGQIFCLANFIKDQEFINEQEFRLVLDPNDGTLEAPNVRYLDPECKDAPYLLFDMRTLATGRLPLKEIIIGPRLDHVQEQRFIENLLDSFYYGSNSCADQPRLVTSKVTVMDGDYAG